MPATTGADVAILLVEDDAGDALLIQEVLAERRAAGTVHLVGDGQEALDFLYRRGAHARAPRPDLILLDLNLPRRSGLEVLTELKRDADLAAIPVVVLTTSAAEADVHAVYNQYANAYVTKPLDWDQFTRAIAQIDDFFTRTARLPAQPAA